MSDEVYTLGAWRVKEGKQAEFIAAWRALGSYFNGLPHPPGKGTLVQRVDDPQEFGFPRGRHRGRPPGCFAGWNGRYATPEKVVEHTLDGIAAAEDNGRNLGHGTSLMGE